MDLSLEAHARQVSPVSGIKICRLSLELLPYVLMSLDTIDGANSVLRHFISSSESPLDT